MDPRKRLLAVALIVAGLVVVACSPEATRTRSGGPGADPGNRGASVELHGRNVPEQMFYQTPAVGQGIQKQQQR
jgi:hypothetical protein